ncbi:phosphopantetheine-binding protein, partial [Rhizobium leguminosarum]|uniref:phosphopantetheine-binding protein n=1 Tax=Rhizobium leguminosarum TaxID=384 RepID=UPI003F9A361F
LEHEAIRQAVVVAREDEPGDKRLVAYMVCARDIAPETGELREHLRRSLPDYMVPSAFMTLEALPLTPNGKLDRRALPAPEIAVDQIGYVAPRTPAEEVIAAIWAEVLRVEKVGIHDNFFELGGHSLLVTRIIARIRETLLLEIPLRSIFQAPSIAEFGANLESIATPQYRQRLELIGNRIRDLQEG